MKSKIWYIYKITNLLTNKSYIGQRLSKTNNHLDDGYYGSGTYIVSSIKKHGLENFKKEILKDDIHCQTSANIFEEYFIKKENTLSPNGYNLRSSSLQNCIIAEDVRKKISNTLKGKVSSKKGTKQRPLTEKEKDERRIYMLSLTNEQKEKRKSAHNKAHTGRKISEETRNKMKESSINNPKKIGHKRNIKGKTLLEFYIEKGHTVEEAEIKSLLVRTKPESFKQKTKEAAFNRLKKLGLKNWSSVKNRKQLEVNKKLCLKNDKEKIFTIKNIIYHVNIKNRNMIYYVLDNGKEISYFDAIKYYYIEVLRICPS